MVCIRFNFAMLGYIFSFSCYYLGKLGFISIPYHSIYSVLLFDSIRMLFPTHQNSEKHRTHLVSSRTSYLDIDIAIFVIVSRQYSYCFDIPLVSSDLGNIYLSVLCGTSISTSRVTSKYRDLHRDIATALHYLSYHSWKGYSPTRIY